MLSVILYGRNDAHGYNLHKRAAISLNCIAEMLSDSDDEILFVDYNTPDDLPTFIEAIYDTLTPKAKSLLRVLRVRPELHARMVTERTHLLALEPHSRNIAIRRSNPRNRWLLFTNSDMIFLPKSGVSTLPEAVRDLPDGQYILPRFDLPEPVWEGWPRSDPQVIMQACDRLGPALHLDEVTISHRYMLFDAPGDFQLAPRQTLFDIHGFDERMIHGWHVDSNMCKRLYLLFGDRTESLAHRLRGYHCDHTRVATLSHRLDFKLENDLQEFVYGVMNPVAPGQAETWGAPAESIEELDFAGGLQARYTGAVECVLGAPQQIEYHSDSNDTRNFVYYQPEHVLTFLAGYLTTYPRDARFVYLGTHLRMLDLIARCILEMGFTHPLSYVQDLLSGEAGVDSTVAITAGSDLFNEHALLIFDFGLDLAGTNLDQIARINDWPRDRRYGLGEVARSLETCAESSNAVWRALRRTPDFIVLNANHYVFRQFVAQFLLTTDTPYNTHVRKGRPRVGDERLYRSHGWKHTELCMRSWFGYCPGANSLAVVEAGHKIDLTSSGQSACYKDGAWGFMDSSGTWTDGSRASILFSLPPSVDHDLSVHVIIAGANLGQDSEPIRVQAWFGDELLVRWEIGSRYGLTKCKALLPARLMLGNQFCRLTFHVENPQATKLFVGDSRELGVKIQRITFTETQPVPISIGDQVDFTQAGTVAFGISECWTHPDDLGAWTLGPDASYSLYLTEAAEAPMIASFTITDVAVNQDYPSLKVEVRFNSILLAEWALGPDRSIDVRKILLPLDFLREQRRFNISFHLDEPRTPVQLKWSETDTRPLGFRLTRLSLKAVEVRPYCVGTVIDLTSEENSLGYLGTHWSPPDRYGVWTIGPEATMTMRFTNPPETGISASFVITDCMVSESDPNLPILIKANGQVLAEWRLGPDRVPHRRTVHLPAELVTTNAELTLSFEVPTPRSPASLGWSGDSRPLGVRLARVMLGEGELEIPIFEPSHQHANGASPSRGTFLRLLDFAMRRIRMAFRGGS